MSLFQKSVLKNYIASLDETKVKAAYDIFHSYFSNPTTQQNIRNSKEEQFQEGFLRELFVKILRYTLNPDPDFNLISELKNVSDAKKADGAIIINEKVVGVIELKRTNTIDLGKIQQQAFYYLSAHPEAVYVITSNFEKLRFYIQKSNEYEEFSLFALTYDQFKLLYLCVSLESIQANLPLRIKHESLVKEENITKQLYKDYSKFKQDLFADLCKRNQDIDKLTLFKATQKLIDRFLFIFFCEDNNGLLPANSISEIIKHWMKLRDMDEYRPLYDIFKKYFEYINTGRPESSDKREIFAYNGGLFAKDELLDQLLIEDTLLYTHTQRLSTYDFISEVDVNILGHIFEHSLNEIEEIQAEIEGNAVEKSKTKRKKEGVFYTPKYITEYIVENTVGKLCTDKKA
nr:restriction endonuclease subunit M [Saprospiraceae bacterium]